MYQRYTIEEVEAFIIATDIRKKIQQNYSIFDGSIMKNNLEKLGKSKEWLEKQLHDKGIKNKKEILLATLDQTDKLIIYRDNEDVIPLDILE